MQIVHLLLLDMLLLLLLLSLLLLLLICLLWLPHAGVSRSRLLPVLPIKLPHLHGSHRPWVYAVDCHSEAL